MSFPKSQAKKMFQLKWLKNSMKELSAVIDRFEEKKAVLKFSDGQTLIVPIEYLPDDAGEGDAIKIKFGNDVDTTDKRAQQAKDMLNEILKKGK